MALTFFWIILAGFKWPCKENWIKHVLVCACTPPYLEELVDLGEVDSLLGVQLVDVAAVSIH